MKTRIVRIGNSQGIRIPKPLLEAAGLRGEVDLITRHGVLLIRPARSPRAGWAESFPALAQPGDNLVPRLRLGMPAARLRLAEPASLSA